MSRPARDWDVIVVGAGYGGVTVAALLADAGKRVLLIDKNGTPGGKAMRAGHDGLTYDLWPIAGGPTRGSRFDDLTRLVGLPVDTRIEADPAAEFVYIDRNGRRRSLRVPARPIRDPLLLPRIALALGVAPWRLGGATRMHLSAILVQALGRIDQYDHVDMLSWMRRFNLPGPILDWTATLMNLFFVVPVDELPASEGILTLRAVALGGAGRYHRGGYGRIAEAAVRFVETHGGAWLPATRVERIMISAGRVTGVTTSHGDFSAPVVISNAGIQPTVLKLIENGALPAQYVDRVRALRPSWAFCGIRYELDAKLIDVPMTVVFSPDAWWDRVRYQAAQAGDWGRQPLIFVTVPALYDPALSTPAVPQVVLAGILGSAQPDDPMNEAGIAELDRQMRRHWPDLERHVIRRQAYTSTEVSRTTRDAVVPGQGGECIGLGQLIGQCGRSKPSARGPVNGLYFVGTDAGGRGIGTTQAVDSGYQVAAMVLEDRLVRLD